MLHRSSRRLLCVLVLGASLFVLFQAAAILRAHPASCGIEGIAADPPTFASCQQCHDQFPVNAGDGSLTLSGLPERWTANSTYRVTASLADPGQSLWGIRLTILDDDGLNLGSLSPVDLNSSTCNAAGRTYLRQTGPGRRAGVPDGPIDWIFDWTTPTAGAGAASAFVVGIACNFDGREEGDFTYTGATMVPEEGQASPEVTVILQPQSPVVAAGSELRVFARIKNHTASPRTVFLGSRARLASGRVVPANGSILPPERVDLAPFELQSRLLLHPIPAGAASRTVQYEGLIGTPPATILDRDAFELTVP